ncbi:MAG: ThuA domain-containing protein [Akkermansiaceae bacterium]|jgi:type 1 glutamine amidotransferase|tara:strand:+ start:1271 stop:2044 length:774 start_codon:yes stop_codon:yes gene_type:complete
MKLNWIIQCVAAVTLLMGASQAEGENKQFYKGKPIKALLITGGCCHNYKFQSKALTMASEAKAPIQWTVHNKGGKGTHAEIELYNDPNWAKPYDVVVHNECFAKTSNPEYIRKITEAHKKGVPAVVIHCAMHTYRDTKIDDWRQFLGVTSRHHEHQSRYPVKVVKKDHPTLKGFPLDWVTPKDELYIVKHVAKTTTPLVTAKSEKNGAVQPVIWINDFHGTRVFGTTFGHTDATFSDPVFLDLLTRGILWSAGKLDK